MSILLEALRKSEKDQQKVEAPTIHSDEYSKPVSKVLKKGPLALFLIVVLLMTAGFAWQQYQKPAEVGQPPAALTPDKTEASAKTTGPDKTRVPDAPLAKLETRDNKKAPSATVASVAAGRQRTPVESYQQATSSGSKAQTGAGKARPSKATKTVTQTGEGGNKKPATKKPVAKKPKAKKPAAKKPAVNKSAASKPTAAAPKKFRPQPPAPISYWELPDAIRAVVPEMKFSVLVYAKDPADRFVLIDGQRFGQGDQVQPELFVTKIRRESVVFRYRLYKFSVER